MLTLFKGDRIQEESKKWYQPKPSLELEQGTYFSPTVVELLSESVQDSFFLVGSSWLLIVKESSSEHPSSHTSLLNSF